MSQNELAIAKDIARKAWKQAWKLSEDAKNATAHAQSASATVKELELGEKNECG